MKKKLIKAIGMVMALVIATSALTACGSEDANQTESTSGQVELIE